MLEPETYREQIKYLLKIFVGMSHNSLLAYVDIKKLYLYIHGQQALIMVLTAHKGVNHGSYSRQSWHHGCAM